MRSVGVRREDKDEWEARVPLVPSDVQRLLSTGQMRLTVQPSGQRVFSDMQKLGVIVRPMGGYQLPEWIRISIGTPKENERCLKALKAVL